MTDLLAILAGSFMTALSGALMPGPVLTVSVARVAARGFGAAPRIILGHALLELAVVIGLFWGLQDVLQGQRVQGAIGLVGGGVLLWMGAGVLQAVRAGRVHLDLDGTSPIARGGARRDVGLGIITSASNPYWFLWWATVGVAWATEAGRAGLPGIAAFYVGHISGDFAWYTFVGACVAAGRHHINERIYRGFLVVCALFLVALSLWFIATRAPLLVAGRA